MNVEKAIEDLYTRIDSMSTAEVDQLNLGAIQLDSDGKVLAYNRYESDLARMRPEDVIGKNFFRDVAPCTDVQEFAGRFREGVRKKALHTKFRYRFVFKDQPARNVIIVMHYSTQTHTTWVFVQPMNT